MSFLPIILSTNSENGVHSIDLLLALLMNLPSARQYGNVIFVQVMNQTIIVLHTPTLVKEVFEKHSISNSNHPASVLVELITPRNLNLGTGHYGIFGSDRYTCSSLSDTRHQKMTPGRLCEKHLRACLQKKA